MKLAHCQRRQSLLHIYCMGDLFHVLHQIILTFGPYSFIRTLTVKPVIINLILMGELKILDSAVTMGIIASRSPQKAPFSEITDGLLKIAGQKEIKLLPALPAI